MNEGTKGDDMTQETVSALADKAGLWYPMGGSPDALHGRARLAAFAQLVVAAERERCAALCEQEICACCWNDEAAEAANHLATEIRKTPNV